MVTPDAGWPAKFTFDEFWNFTEPLEGGMAADCMFLVQDLQVATAMGITFTGNTNRNPGLLMAKALDWVYKPGHLQAGQRCSPSDIERDYDKVLSNEELGRRGPGFLGKWKDMTNCRITREGLQRAVRSKVIGNINYVKTRRSGNKHVGDFDSFPADAQLCVISLTWANGNEFGYPTFCRACREADWFEASRQCGFKSKENTLALRQKQQEEMMRNAACIAQGVATGDTLQWPKILAAPDLSWLLGWWTVWDGNDYYYFFADAGQVVYTETKPTTSAAPGSPTNRGTYSFHGLGQMVVRWNALPGLGPAIETFYNARPGAPQMNANSNMYSPLVATKIP